MNGSQVVTVALTRFQARVVADALTLYTEGAQGQQTQLELRAAGSARRKISRVLTAPVLPDSGAST